jgi:endonuclease III
MAASIQALSPLDGLARSGSSQSAPKVPASRVVRVPIGDFSELNVANRQEHLAWSKRLATRLQSSMGLRLEAAESIVERLNSELLVALQLLSAIHGTPDLGNKTDPVDELVYIALSRRTREGAYQAAYDLLKSHYVRWRDLAEAPATEIEILVAFSGLGRRKAKTLKQALAVLITRFGDCTLEPTRSWDDARTAEFLCTLPEIGPKSAACVMVCSLDRPAFPVDAHVGRVLQRLGVFRMLDIELHGTDHKTKQRLLWDAVPPALRYSLHVNLLVHGRVVCLPRKPRCHACVLSERCAYICKTRVASNV